MIKLETNDFLKFEKKKLFKKLTEYIGNKIESTTDYDKIEIAQHIGISTSRFSEWKNYDHYKQIMSENNLIRCIVGGIVTVNELIEKCAETEKEREYLTALKIHENKGLQKAIAEAEENGIDVEKILQILNKIKDSGIEPIEILNNFLKSKKIK